MRIVIFSHLFALPGPLLLQRCGNLNPEQLMLEIFVERERIRVQNTLTRRALHKHCSRRSRQICARQSVQGPREMGRIQAGAIYQGRIRPYIGVLESIEDRALGNGDHQLFRALAELCLDHARTLMYKNQARMRDVKVESSP